MKTENIGWQCPKCLVVYAPNIEKCECSILATVSLSGGSIGGVGSIGHITVGNSSSTGTTYICSGYVSETGDGICTKCAKPKWNHYSVSYT